MTYKIKAGDLVIACETDTDITRGRTYKVVAVWDDCIQFYDNNGEFRTRRARDYELKSEAKIKTKTTQKKTMKFNKGDRVRLTRSIRRLGASKGAEAVVTGYANTDFGLMVSVKWDRTNGLAGDQMNGNYLVSNFTKIEPETAQEDTMKFKKGDRVRIINPRCGPPKGTLGTVYDADELDVILDNWTEGHDGEANDYSTNHWYCFESDIEKVVEEAPEPSMMDDLGGDFEGDFRTSSFTSKMWIVAVLDSECKPRPNNKARTYTSAAQARRVAREMAERHKGETFVVFEAVGGAAHPRNPDFYFDL